MTEAEVRGYLRGIKILTEKRVKKLEQIEELRSVATNCVASTDKEPVQTSGSGDKMANIVGKIVDLTREVNDIDRIVQERTWILMVLSKNFSDERYQEYMFTRYIDCNSFYDTVMKMDLADSTARRIEKKMILELANLMNESQHNI